jgi:hypothetical protein
VKDLKAIDLRRILQTMIQRGISVEACFVLEEMLDRGELNCRTADESGKQLWAAAPKDSSPILDRIAGIPHEGQRPILELFAMGFLEFSVGDFGRGLDIYWNRREVSHGHLQ